MKKLLNILGIISIFAIILSAFSCSDDDDVSGNPVQIYSVSLAKNDSAVTVGYKNNYYIIRGKGFNTTKKVLFNGAQADLNLTMVTGTTIIVQIPDDTPILNASNKIEVITSAGTATYDFTVSVEPIIYNFVSNNISAGDQVKIYGKYFIDVQKVYFGSAQVTNFTVNDDATIITATVPSGVENKDYCKVTTLGGTATSSQRVGSGFYDDYLASGVSEGGWGYTSSLTNTSFVNTGAYSIQCAYQGGWNGYCFYLPSVSTAGIKAIRISLKSTIADSKVKICINDWSIYSDANTVKTLTTDWQSFVIPLSSFTNSVPSSLSMIGIQEFSGNTNTIYIDDVGYVYE